MALTDRQRQLTKDEADWLFLWSLEDDTEDAPWMTMGDLQFWSASSLAHSLRTYAHERNLGWYVASMLPILYSIPALARPTSSRATASRSRKPGSKRKQLSPDLFVAFVPEHPRQSFDSEREGGFPPFVLEVISPSSTDRDETDKLRAYEVLGVREYALFTPREGRESQLAGYRRGESGEFEPWLPDAEGRLWSETLGLFFVVRGPLLQAQTADGRLLLTPEQSGVALRDAEIAQQREREEAEAEIARLRQELARLRGEGGE